MVWLPDGEIIEDTITRFDEVYERDRRTHSRARMTAWPQLHRIAHRKKELSVNTTVVAECC